MQSPTTTIASLSKDEEPESRYNLFPTTPLNTKRYEERPAWTGEPCEDEISAGILPSCLSPARPAGSGWHKYTHPEGKPYFVCGFGPRIVTEADMNDPATLELVNSYAQLISDWAAKQKQPAASVELFLEPEVHTGFCHYYLVDHLARTTFWLEQVSAERLDLPQTYSPNHLKLALEECYWKHVEMFGMHLAELPGALEELVAIYLHGRADLSTSNSSTFVWSPEMTETHIQILKDCRDAPTNPVTFTVIGRLYGYVAHWRFQNLYGDSCARLDRTTRIFEHEEEKPSLLSRGLSAVMFGLPEGMRAQLDEQYVDCLVVGHVWSAFVDHLMCEWATVMQWTFALIVANVLSVLISPVPLLAHLSLVLCVIALLTAVLLQLRFKSMSSDVDAASSFMDSQDGKIMPLAIVLCIPRAAFLWALVLFALQAFMLLLSSVPLAARIIMCFTLLVVAIAARKIICPSDGSARRRCPLFSLFSVLRRGERLMGGEIRLV